MAGVGIRTVQKLMGHKTIQAVMVYAHFVPWRQLEAVRRLCDTGNALREATDADLNEVHRFASVRMN